MSSLAQSSVAQRARKKEGHKFGGSPEGIKHHYDIGNDFWRLMLGPTFTYSAALFTDPNDDLDTAQNRKINWHMASANAHNARSVLEVGCGWGTILKRLSRNQSIERIVGLTLSEAQAQWLRALEMRGTEIRVENWAVYEPETTFDSIISIGAFEHFAKPDETEEEKLAVYREFFERCHRWLKPTGRMSLQTIAYGTMKREQANPFMYTEIYPESDLPTMSEIVAAVDGLFEVIAFRNDRFDYARSYDEWLRNLRDRRAEAVQMVGEDEVRRFEKFYKIGSIGFRMGKIQLHRYALRPISSNWSAMGAELPRDAVRLLA
jgi:cyclopropane-fatty-acyl-phospholipid synthase